LRKLIGTAFKNHGFTPVTTKGVEKKYASTSGDTIRVDFGSRMGQVCYRVSALRKNFRLVMMSYESLWSQAGGWDYLTEENAARTIDLLPELVEYLISLTDRVAGLADR